MKVSKNLIPSNLKVRLKRILYLSEYYYDYKRYLKFSFTNKDSFNGEQLNANIIKHYHVIEKGLSLIDTRVGFGEKVIKSLMKLLETSIKNGYSKDNISFQSAISTLKSYVKFHEGKDYDITWLVEKLEKLNSSNEIINCHGGIINLTKDEILKSKNSNFAELAASRYSHRIFTPEEVKLEDIKDAIKIAQKTPSVCNRQSSRIYVLRNKEMIQKALSCQNGNRGFSHLVGTLLIITSDLQSFTGIHEKNQSFIDGGLFSMSIMYALHHKGLGTCPLNWSTSKSQDLKLRSKINIPESENIIMMIAVGHIPEKVKVANSQRLDFNDVFKAI